MKLLINKNLRDVIKYLTKNNFNWWYQFSYWNGYLIQKSSRGMIISSVANFNSPAFTEYKIISEETNFSQDFLAGIFKEGREIKFKEKKMEYYYLAFGESYELF